MSYYNGEYEHTLFLIVESDSHEITQRFMKKLKNAIDPWFFQITHQNETKSARKGDVLKRTLYVRHVAYSQDIIIFNEMLKTLIFNYNLHFDVNILIDDRGIIPEESRRNLIS